MAGSVFDNPPLQRLKNDMVRLITINKPPLDRLVNVLEGPPKWMIPNSKIPMCENIASLKMVTFRVWGKELVRGCDNCGSKTNALVVIPRPEINGGADIYCDKHTPRYGELWAGYAGLNNSYLEIGEASADIVERPQSVLMNSLKALYMVFSPQKMTK